MEKKMETTIQGLYKDRYETLQGFPIALVSVRSFGLVLYGGPYDLESSALCRL